jgi:serine/threonine protein phosphatase PrpC
MIPWIAAKADHLGARREQQDRVTVLTFPPRRECLVLVSDGVGGMAGGGLASQAVLDVANKLWAAQKTQPVSPRDFLLKLCQLAHREISRIGKEIDEGPRATIAAAYVYGGEACWVHSGDSRVYQFRDSVMVSRTRDHSILQVLVDRGSVKEEEMGTHPDQGKLLQSLGGDEFKVPTIGNGRVGPGDAFLVCSDGFWEHITPKEIGGMFATGPDLPRSLQQHVNLAAKRGGAKADNVSAAAVALVGKRSPADYAALALDFAREHVLILVLVVFMLFGVIVLLLLPAKPPPVRGDQNGQTGTANSNGAPGLGGLGVNSAATPERKIHSDAPAITTPLPGHQDETVDPTQLKKGSGPGGNDASNATSPPAPQSLSTDVKSSEIRPPPASTPPQADPVPVKAPFVGTPPPGATEKALRDKKERDAAAARDAAKRTGGFHKTPGEAVHQ